MLNITLEEAAVELERACGDRDHAERCREGYWLTMMERALPPGTPVLKSGVYDSSNESVVQLNIQASNLLEEALTLVVKQTIDKAGVEATAEGMGYVDIDSEELLTELMVVDLFEMLFAA